MIYFCSVPRGHVAETLLMLARKFGPVQYMKGGPARVWVKIEGTSVEELESLDPIQDVIVSSNQTADNFRNLSI